MPENNKYLETNNGFLENMVDDAVKSHHPIFKSMIEDYINHNMIDRLDSEFIQKKVDAYMSTHDETLIQSIDNKLVALLDLFIEGDKLKHDMFVEMKEKYQELSKKYKELKEKIALPEELITFNPIH
jgi:hypothetical protein